MVTNHNKEVIKVIGNNFEMFKKIYGVSDIKYKRYDDLIQCYNNLYPRYVYEDIIETCSKEICNKL